MRLLIVTDAKLFSREQLIARLFLQVTRMLRILERIAETYLAEAEASALAEALADASALKTPKQMS